MLTAITRSDDIREIENHVQEECAKVMSKTLADTFSLYMKTLNFHWNVEGQNFYAIHKITESQYKSMATSLDTIAERIRALGYYAPGSYKEFKELTSILDCLSEYRHDYDIVKQLMNDHMTMIGALKESIEVLEEAKDPVSVDLLTARLAFHEDAAWKLRSMLKN